MSLLKCTSSQWFLTVSPDSWVHLYDVNVQFGPIEKLNNDLSKSTKDVKLLTKCPFADSKQICRHIIDNLAELDGTTYVYDNHSYLITNKPLKSDIKIIRDQRDLDSVLKQHLVNQQAVLKLEITKSKTINLTDFPIDAATTLTEDRTYRTVCEMILSEFAVTRPNNQYISIGPGHLCETKSTPFDSGLYSRDGNKKGVEVIEGCNGPQLCVTLDFRRKILFPGEMSLLQLFHIFLQNGGKIHEAEALFRNLKVFPVYEPDRTLFFKKFSDLTIRRLKLDDGRSLEEYFHGWNTSLRHLDEPAAQMSNGSGQFPMELLGIFPNQIVPLAKMPKKLKEKAIELNRVKAEIRFVQIQREYEKLAMNNRISGAFGLKVNPQMISGEYQRLQRMKIILHQSTVISDDDGSFKFKQEKYYKAAKIDGIVILSTRKDYQKSKECVDKIVIEARRKGMTMPEPIFHEFNTFSQSLIEWEMALNKYKDVKTLVFIVDGNYESHPIVKLAQALTGIQTQHLFFDTAFKVAKGRPQTLENIVHKINIKGGGINQLVDFGPKLGKIMDETLIISMDVCHPTGFCYEDDEPSTVGLVANYLPNPNEFAGIFFYQKDSSKRCQENVDEILLKLFVKKMIQEAQKYRTIKNVILIRDGISEGQYSKFVEKEIEAIRRATNELSIEAKIVAIIVTKEGITRHFMDTSKGRPESMPPRSFISFGCRFGFRQFFMISHKAGLGTAKSVMITVIRDDLELSTIELQTFLLGLTLLHQIVSSPVSIPAPLFQADVLAQHGQKLFYAMKKYADSDIPRNANGIIDFMKLTTLLNFNNEELPMTRYTA